MAFECPREGIVNGCDRCPANKACLEELMDWTQHVDQQRAQGAA